MLKFLGLEEFDAVNEFGVVCESEENFAGCQFPDYNLGVFSRTRYEPVALADVDFCDVVFVSVQGRLQLHSVLVPDLNCSVKAMVKEGLRSFGLTLRRQLKL